jgi:uncharacterized protein with HEPN domain
MDDRDREYLRLALESAYLVQRYAASRGPDWREDGVVLDAICKRIEELGYNLWRVSDDVRVVYPQVPWRKASGMRHIIAHDYAAIDVEIVVRVVAEHVPGLILQLEDLLRS